MEIKSINPLWEENKNNMPDWNKTTEICQQWTSNWVPW